MYHIAKLSQPSMTALIALQNKGANHNRAFQLALGYVIGSNLALPAGGTEDAVGYFRMNHALGIRETLSCINELMPFDMRAAEDDIRGFFQFRLNQINMPKISLAINPESSLVDFFSISSCFSKDAIDAVVNKGADLTNFIVQLTPIYEDLRKSSSTSENGVISVNDANKEYVPG